MKGNRAWRRSPRFAQKNEQEAVEETKSVSIQEVVEGSKSNQEKESAEPSSRESFEEEEVEIVFQSDNLVERDQDKQDNAESERRQMLTDFEILQEKVKGVDENTLNAFKVRLSQEVIAYVNQEVSALGATVLELRRSLEEAIADFRKKFDKVWSSSAIVEERFDLVDDDVESYIYEEEVFDSMSDDEVLLSSEDKDFVDSIRNPIFSGIHLSSSCDYSTLSVPILSNQDDSVALSHALVVISQKYSSYKILFDVTDSLMLNKNCFNNRLIVNIIYYYIIYVWDPGIFYSILHFSLFLLQSIHIMYFFIPYMYCLLY